jgi:signal transduction histidine kinase
MSEQLQEQMNSMGQQNMEKDTQAIRRLADRGLFLSHRMESLTESAVGQGSDSVALQHARVYLREMERINQVWAELAQGNPFMGRSVQQLLRDSRDRLAYGLDAGQGTTWVGLHETRQSMIALNAAIFEMLQDMQQMQQQMQQQMGMQSMQQQMQQLLSQQQSLSEMLEQMREMGEEGEAMMQRMREMARQQAQVRKEIEKMMQQYRHAKQIRQQLEGIYQEMDEVEQLLEQGVNDERVEEKQKRILSRMLEAGTFQEKDEFGKERKAETATRDRVSEKPNEKVPLQLKDRIQRASEQPVDEKIPSQYREAIKNHFIRLSEKMAQ